MILVPGFLGSELVDVQGPDGLIWVDPKLLLFGTDKLLDLRLNPLPDRPGVAESDANSGVVVRPNGSIPVLYSGIKYDLEVRRYSVQIFGFDWRKDIEESAGILAALIRDRARQRFRPLHIVAHSQGTVVARRAVQLVGADLARNLVTNLVLLGPATAGTFAAAFAIAGNSSLIDMVRQYHIEPPPGFPGVLQSMTGLYQLLPWRTEPVDGHSAGDLALKWVEENAAAMKTPDFWKTGVDPVRLDKKYGWGRIVDTSFLNDRTTIILGDQPTVGGVKFEGGRLVEDPAFATSGDGTVPDALARLAGVVRVFKAKGAEHMMLPATLSVIAAVRDVLAGRRPQVQTVPFGVSAPDVPFLAEPPAEPLPTPRKAAVAVVPPGKPPAQPPGPPEAPAVRPLGVADEAREVPPPQNRRLRVYSFDPLFGSDLDALDIDQITFELPWDFADGDHLRPGPVGEYLEVVDVDPSSGLFYPPVDLNHPHLLAQDGLPAAEGNPRFHQQMAYAVAMGTIRQFEMALGRKAAVGRPPEAGQQGRGHPGAAAPGPVRPAAADLPARPPAGQRLLPPGPARAAVRLLPAQGPDVGRNLPGGTVFASLSYDIIAHETTHALLHGLHRYLLEPSNPDVFAFHEAFADIVAMFQHFSHPEVLSHQLRRDQGRPGAGESARGPGGAVRRGDGPARGPPPVSRPADDDARRQGGLGADPARPSADPRDQRAARPRGDPGGGAVPGLQEYLRGPGPGPAADRHRRDRHPAPGRPAPRPDPADGRRGGQVRPAHAPDVHPGAGLYPAGRHHVRRISPGADHRRL